MRLFTIYENGALRKAKKIDFADHKVFLIDDEKHIYLWIGKNASQNKRNLSVERAKKYISKRNKKPDLEVLYQGREYGSFLSIIEKLKQSDSSKINLKRRNELKIKINDTLELIEAGIEPDFEAKITLKAHKLSEENKSYEELCEILAKLQLKLLDTKKNIKRKEIKEKAKEIRQSSSTYDELCWLIAELRLLQQK